MRCSPSVSRQLLCSHRKRDHAEKGASGLSPVTEIVLLWANFAILAIGLGYLVKKYGGPFFAARSERIQREIVEAAKVRQDAEARSAEVDRRLANLQADLAALRAESRKELESLERHTTSKASAEIARIQSNAEQEIAAAGKAARLELKRYSAELAVHLAGEKIQARMTPQCPGCAGARLRKRTRWPRPSRAGQLKRQP